MYAGNVGFSQSLDSCSPPLRRCPDVTFVINGDGAARPSSSGDAAGLPNVRFAGYQPDERLPEVLATGDIHVVPLRRRPRRRQRAVEDLLDPRRRPAGAGGDRPRHRGAAASWPRPAPASPCAPDDPAAFVAALGRAARRPGSGGARWAPPAGAGSRPRPRPRRSAGAYDRCSIDAERCVTPERCAGTHRGSGLRAWDAADSPLACLPVASPHRPTKKVAKLAQQGKGKKVRFQGGTCSHRGRGHR